MRLDFRVRDPRAALHTIQEAENRLVFKHPNIMQMLDFSFSPCLGSSGEVVVSGYFEYPNWDLRGELNDRMKDCSLFPPEELQLMLENILSAMAFL